MRAPPIKRKRGPGQGRPASENTNRQLFNRAPRRLQARRPTFTELRVARAFYQPARGAR
jgi:hypothetical protein